MWEFLNACIHTCLDERFCRTTDIPQLLKYAIEITQLSLKQPQN